MVAEDAKSEARLYGDALREATLVDLDGVPPCPQGSPCRSHRQANADVARVGWGFISLYTLAYISTCLLFLAPALVSLALKVNSLVGIERAPGSLALIASVGALLALFGNPFFGRLSDRTTSSLGRRRPWLVAGLVVGSAGILVVALAPSVAVVLVGWCVAQLSFNAVLAALAAVMPDQVPAEQRGLVAWEHTVAQVGLRSASSTSGRGPAERSCAPSCDHQADEADEADEAVEMPARISGQAIAAGASRTSLNPALECAAKERLVPLTYSQKGLPCGAAVAQGQPRVRLSRPQLVPQELNGTLVDLLRPPT